MNNISRNYHVINQKISFKPEIDFDFPVHVVAIYLIILWYTIVAITKYGDALQQV